MRVGGLAVLSGFGWVSLLLAGLALGSIARFALRGKVSLSWAETILVGIVGAGIGTTTLSVFSGSAAFEPTVLSIASAVGGSIAVLAVYTAVVSNLPRRPAKPISEILGAGESGHVEFKRTARHNVRTGQRDARLEMAVAKTVAGFLNGDGGTLVIGVDDTGMAVGLDDDLRHMRQPDFDRYHLWLTDMLQSTLGSAPIASISVAFPPCGPHNVVRLDVDPHPRAVFVNPPGGHRAADFYVRIGNSTRLLLTDEAMAYAATRWTWWRKAVRRSTSRS